MTVLLTGAFGNMEAGDRVADDANYQLRRANKGSQYHAIGCGITGSGNIRSYW
jgi:hypothetical protein